MGNVVILIVDSCAFFFLRKFVPLPSKYYFAGMKKIFYVWFFANLFMLFSACNHTGRYEFHEISVLLDDKPDSALHKLRKINVESLSNQKRAEYALLFTIAQDKSGLDVDDDSLIRIAYDWYAKHQEDSLYGKCLYYMGKYYMLNDSVEQSVLCLKESYAQALKQKDMKIGSLALEKLSKVVRDINPKAALEYSRKAMSCYDKCKQTKLANKIYLRLNYDEALCFAGYTQRALEDYGLLLGDAYSLGDSTVLADVYQDIANFYLNLGMRDSCLACACKAYSLRPEKNLSCRLMLASAFVVVDSLQKAKRVLNGIDTKNCSDLVVKYDMLREISYKEVDLAKIKQYSDSASYYLEKMNQEAVADKVRYYTKAIAKEKEHSVLEEKSKVQNLILSLVTMLVLLVLAFVLYAFYQVRIRSAKRLAFEKERAEIHIRNNREAYEQEKWIIDKMYQQELSQKEAQLEIIRNYLLKNISIVKKLNDMKKKETARVVISDEDWEEIEAFLESSENMFVTRLRKMYPHLAKKELRLMMLLRLKISQKDLASIYNVSEKAIKQRLYLYKDKVGIVGQEYSLRGYIESL